MAARKPRQPKFALSDEHRLKIQNSKILNNLIEHTMGDRDMSQTQVTASINLLKKVMPDLSAITMEADVKHDLSDDMKTLMNMASDKTKRVGE